MEVLLGIGIGCIVIFGITALYLSSWRAQGTISQSLSAQQEGRHFLQDFVSEVRAAEQSSTGAYSLEVTAAQQLVFYSDIDGDGNRERVRYFLTGTTLQKGVLKPTGTPPVYVAGNEKITDVVHYVTNGATPIFTYYDQSYIGSGSPLADPVNVTQVRMVGLELNLQPSNSGASAPVVIETKTQIRNLKSN